MNPFCSSPGEKENQEGKVERSAKKMSKWGSGVGGAGGRQRA